MANDKAWPRRTLSLWGGLRVLLILALIIQALLIPVSAYELWHGVLSAEEMAQDLTAIIVALASGALAVAWIIVFVLTVIYTCRITFRMMKNLDTLNAPGERMSPTMAVVWYFIPIAYLLMPYRGFKQIWKGTWDLSPDPAPSDSAVGAWWITWILSNITGTLSFRFSLESGAMDEAGPSNLEAYNAALWLGIASNLLGAIACVFMIAAFGRVSRAQDEIVRARVPA